MTTTADRDQTIEAIATTISNPVQVMALGCDLCAAVELRTAQIPIPLKDLAPDGLEASGAGALR